MQIDNERHQRALENVAKAFGRSGGRGGDVLREAVQDLGVEGDVAYLTDPMHDRNEIEEQLQKLKEDASYKHKDRTVKRMHDPMPIIGILERINKVLLGEE